MKDKRSKLTKGPGRRDLLKLGVAAPALLAAVAGGVRRAEAAGSPEGSGYRRTEHVRRYLESARF